MRHVTIAVLAVTALVAASAVGFCQTPRNLAMGGAGFGLSNDVGGWAYNPAGLAYLDICPIESGAQGDMSVLRWQGIAGSDFGGDYDLDVLHVGAIQGSRGFAIGRLHNSDIGGTALGIGYGTTLGSPRLSVGGAVVNGELGSAHETLFNAGIMYQWQPALSKGKPAKIGLVRDDMTNELESVWNGGVSFWVGQKILIAADVLDITDDTKVAGVDHTGTMFNVGAEVAVAQWLCLRAGSQDGDFSFGAGVNISGWRLDAGFLSRDWGPGTVDTDVQAISISKAFVIN